MKSEISLTLYETEWGQILDGLRCRAENYDETARYYESGCAEHEIAEVSDGGEARQLAQLYRGIIAKIEKGLAEGLLR